MKCGVYCSFSVLRVDIQGLKTKQNKRSRTITIVEYECSNNRGYVKGMWKLAEYFSLELTLRTQHPYT